MRQAHTPSGVVPLNLDVKDILERSFILHLEVFAEVGDKVIDGVAVSNNEAINNECKKWCGIFLLPLCGIDIYIHLS